LGSCAEVGRHQRHKKMPKNSPSLPRINHLHKMVPLMIFFKATRPLPIPGWSQARSLAQGMPLWPFHYMKVTLIILKDLNCI
jgi:hypothetical protein